MQKCGTASSVPGQWQATAGIVFIGDLILFAAVVFSIRSASRSKNLVYARWTAFLAAIFLAIASLIFPVGFGHSTVGGEVGDVT